MASVTFETTVTATGSKTGIVVPQDVMDRLGAGRRPPVIVEVNGYQYRSTIGVMGGRHMIGISAAVRKETGLSGGDPIRVALAVADTPREVHVPDDFAEALAANPQAGTLFITLSNSLQRYHIDNINGAKSPETRQRRIERAVTLLQAGKQR
jgi:hypothetical protein